MFAGLMRKHVFSGKDFIGHVGGDDFFIGLEGCSQAQMTGTIEGLLADFHMEVRQLYSAEDRLRGFLHGHDRDGTEREFALMRCSVGVLELPDGVMIEDLNRISAAIAGIKAGAKKSVSGLCSARLDENGVSEY
jgi:GGDEF domain-containing protein